MSNTPINTIDEPLNLTLEECAEIEALLEAEEWCPEEEEVETPRETTVVTTEETPLTSVTPTSPAVSTSGAHKAESEYEPMFGAIACKKGLGEMIPDVAVTKRVESKDFWPYNKDAGDECHYTLSAGYGPSPMTLSFEVINNPKKLRETLRFILEESMPKKWVTLEQFAMFPNFAGSSKRPRKLFVDMDGPHDRDLTLNLLRQCVRELTGESPRIRETVNVSNHNKRHYIVDMYTTCRYELKAFQLYFERRLRAISMTSTAHHDPAMSIRPPLVRKYDGKSMSVNEKSYHAPVEFFKGRERIMTPRYIAQHEKRNYADPAVIKTLRDEMINRILDYEITVVCDDAGKMLPTFHQRSAEFIKIISDLKEKAKDRGDSGAFYNQTIKVRETSFTVNESLARRLVSKMRPGQINALSVGYKWYNFVSALNCCLPAGASDSVFAAHCKLINGPSVKAAGYDDADERDAIIASNNKCIARTKPNIAQLKLMIENSGLAGRMSKKKLGQWVKDAVDRVNKWSPKASKDPLDPLNLSGIKHLTMTQERYVGTETKLDFSARRVYIKAPMGSGKTTYVYKHIVETLKKWPKHRMVVVAPNIDCSKKLHRDLTKIGLKFSLYSDLEGDIYDQLVVVCVPSVWRIKGDINTILFDESESCVSYHFDNRANDNANACAAWFTRQFTATNQLIFMDADLGPRTIEFVRANDRAPSYFRGSAPNKIGPRTLEYLYLNELQTRKGYNVVVFSDKTTGLEGVVKALKDGKRIYVAVNSIKQGNNFLMYAQDKIPDIKAKFVHRESADREEFINSEPNQYLKKHEIQMLICSPTVTVGKDIRADYFHMCVAVQCESANTPRSFMQQIHRPRGLLDKTVIYFPTWRRNAEPRTMDHIRGTMGNRGMRLTETLWDSETNSMKLVESPTYFAGSIHLYLQDREIYNNLDTTLKMFKSLGYTITGIVPQDAKKFREIKKTVAKRIKTLGAEAQKQKVSEIKAAKPHDYSDLRELTAEERLSHKHFQVRKTLDIPDTTPAEDIPDFMFDDNFLRKVRTTRLIRKGIVYDKHFDSQSSNMEIFKRISSRKKTREHMAVVITNALKHDHESSLDIEPISSTIDTDIWTRADLERAIKRFTKAYNSDIPQVEHVTGKKFRANRDHFNKFRGGNVAFNLDNFRKILKPYGIEINALSKGKKYAFTYNIDPRVDPRYARLYKKAGESM